MGNSNNRNAPIVNRVILSAPTNAQQSAIPLIPLADANSSSSIVINGNKQPIQRRILIPTWALSRVVSASAENSSEPTRRILTVPSLNSIAKPVSISPSSSGVQSISASTVVRSANGFISEIVSQKRQSDNNIDYSQYVIFILYLRQNFKP
jgi:hypothetical protein